MHESGRKWMKLDESETNGRKWIIWMKVDKIEENGFDGRK